MANFLMHMGHTMPDGNSDSRGTNEALVDNASGDVILERRIAVGRGPIGDIAVGSAGVVVTNVGADSVSILDSIGRARGEVPSQVSRPPSSSPRTVPTSPPPP